MSDTSRVEAWLRAHHSTNMTEWDRQPAIDGGNKVTRLARCIGDLKDRGLPIPPSKRIKIGDSWVAEYRLLPETSGWPGAGTPLAVTSPQRSASTKQVPGTPAPNDGTGPGVTPGSVLATHAQCAIDDDWDWAA